MDIWDTSSFNLSQERKIVESYRLDLENFIKSKSNRQIQNTIDKFKTI